MSTSRRDWVARVFQDLLLEDARRWLAQRADEGAKGLGWKEIPPLYQRAFEASDFAATLRDPGTA
jgi:hypothetical protein